MTLQEKLDSVVNSLRICQKFPSGIKAEEIKQIADELDAAIEALQAAKREPDEAMAKDAERYRFLKSIGVSDWLNVAEEHMDGVLDASMIFDNNPTTTPRGG